MGTPDFAVASLKQLVDNNYNVVGVITAPDKKAGRGQKVSQSAVKVYAEQEGLRVLQPEKLKNPVFIEELAALEAHLFIVVAFRMLPEMVWNMPEFGTFNLHASLLPQYRGAAPINWAVINGEKESGVTTFFLQHEIDTGKVIFNERIAITDDDNAGTVHDKLMLSGAKLIAKTVDSIIAQDFTETPQSDLIDAVTELKVAPKIFKDDCRINWNNSVEKVYNLIRGLSPYPAAWSVLANINGKETAAKIFDTKKEDAQHSLENGTIESDGKSYLKVATTNGFINILSIQVAGKKRLPIIDFLRGFQNIQDYSFK